MAALIDGASSPLVFGSFQGTRPLVCSCVLKGVWSLEEGACSEALARKLQAGLELGALQKCNFDGLHRIMRRVI